MDELLNLAEQSGMDKEKGQAVAGGLFAILKEQMDPYEYQQMQARMPEMDSLAERHREENGSTDRGFGSSILGMITKKNSQGSNGGMEYLITTLKKHKVTIAELIIFVPLALWFLKRHYGVDIFNLFGGSNGTSTSATTTSKPTGGKFFGKGIDGSGGDGTPSSSLAGSNAYYDQLLTNNGGGDGRSGDVPPSNGTTPSNNGVYVPAYANSGSSDQYNSNQQYGNNQQYGSNQQYGNNQQYGATNNAYQPSYPGANNMQQNNQNGSDVYVPDYSRTSGNGPAYPANGGYNNQY